MAGVENVVIPRGRLRLARIGANGSPGHWRDVGNSSEMSLETSTETAELRDAGSASGRKIKVVTLSVDRTFSFTLQNADPENLSLYFGSAVQDLSVPAGSESGEDLGVVAGGDIVQLGVTQSRPTGVRHVSSVVLKTNGTIYQQGTDYVVQAELGQVMILPTGIAVGQPVSADYSYAATRRVQIVGDDSELGTLVSLSVISDNVGGPNYDLTIPLAKLTPSGSLGFTSESDWRALEFSCEVLSPSDAFGAPLPSVILEGRPEEVQGS